MQHRKLCFIGAGNMAGAIISGLIESGYPANLISVCAPSGKNRDPLAEKYGVKSSDDNIGCAKEALCSKVCIPALPPVCKMSAS